MTIYQQLENLITVINEYYGCDLRARKRDFLTLDARDMFIHIASSQPFMYSIQMISKTLNLSRSAVIRSRNRSNWQSSKDRYFKERKGYVLKSIENAGIA